MRAGLTRRGRCKVTRLWQDARLALRGFRRSPTFTVTAVLILGIGIGVASAMWAVTSAVLTRPLPVADQDRIIEPRARDAAGVDLSMSPQEALQLARSSRTMREVAAFAHWGAVQAAFKDGDRSVEMYKAQVTGNFFEVLGARPFIGRLLQPEDDSTSHVLVLSYGVWRRQFGGDRAIIGRHLFDPHSNVRLTIVGVAPPGLDYPLGVECWEPPQFTYYVDLVARLAPTATPGAARSEFLAAEREINRQRSVGYHIVAVDVKPLREAIVGDIRQTIIVVTAAVALLLLIACVNVGNLLLLRATTRSRELAVRRALGATAADIFRQLVVESVILAVVGCCLGLVVAAVAERGLIAAAPPQIPNLDVILAAGTPIGTAATVAAFAVLLFGLAPALATIHRSPASPLRVDARSGGTTWQRRRLRHAMVASQVALALIMLTGAGLLTRSLVRLETLPLGYRADHLMMLNLVLPQDMDSMSDVLNGYDRIAPHLRALPGVTAMTPVEVGPFLGPNVFTGPWEVEGQSAEQTNSYPLIPIESGGSEYFRTLGTPILRGRGFVDSDREQAPKVAVVSQSVAQMFWPGQDPVGKRLRFLHDTVWRTVVGVSGDIHYRTLRAATPSVFLPFRQYFWQGNILLRSALTPAALMPSIRRAVAEGDPKVGVWDATSMDDLLAGPLAQPRLSTLVLSMFGLVALILAAVGLYGVMASTVREQTRDIGVRMALGATPQRVRGEVLQRAMLVSLVGAAVGIVGALAGSRVIASLLFEVSPTDPVALLVACGVLLAVAGLAAYVPAYRASRIDPSRALQGE
jgi:putative ABC transport system permease protein